MTIKSGPDFLKKKKKSDPSFAKKKTQLKFEYKFWLKSWFEKFQANCVFNSSSYTILFCFNSYFVTQNGHYVCKCHIVDIKWVIVV